MGGRSRSAGARRIWLLVIIAVGMAFSFVALLVVGVYAAAASLVGGGQALGLAPGAVPAAYQSLVSKWGTLCPAISPSLLAAQLYQESGWNPSARSSAGAEGIAQFMPGTWATYGLNADGGGGGADIWDPGDAIPAAAAYDCRLAKDVSGVPGDNTDNMLAAYNAGVYAVIQAQGIPPFPETRNYVRSIRTLAQSFAAPVLAPEASQQAGGAIYYAESKLGTPYLWGGTGTAAEQGRFDCSGLTQAAYASVGIALPRVAADQWNAGPHPSRDQMLPGDLVFYAKDTTDPRTIEHVGIYVGGGYMIDAPHTGARIRFDPIDLPGYIGATRVTQAGAAALPAPTLP